MGHTALLLNGKAVYFALVNDMANDIANGTLTPEFVCIFFWQR